MKVEIWSDIMCPFCYIGKRRFEAALKQFPYKEDIEVVWKSFRLNPAMKTDPGKNINQYLARIKGWTVEQAKQVNEHVTQMAREVGLHYDFDKAIVANSFDAHRLIQLAKANGKGDEMEERLFSAYFIEGKDTSNHETLILLGTEVGLNAADIQKMLASHEYAEYVERDIYESQQIGVRGVPYFVFNDRYAVTGAQASETFLGALTKAWGEWEKQQSELKEIGGDVEACKPGKNCV
ncbi:DsbA family oxidoreductase [Terrimonas pollutisoli]|uniref:DsbA family oxidoreductase n=1 Tax=Terrimonas pollutisoli TaxID=3034147 RepID=UPI0023EAF523|nr:DsbA family oxidoreductase [Terrimonas sp. H1YJ31]